MSDPAPVPVLSSPRILPISKREQEHPEIWKVHEASSLTSTDEVTQWLRVKEKRILGKVDLRGHSQEQTHDRIDTLGDVILRRGSTRRFSHTAISKNQLSTILFCSTRGIPFDILGEHESLIDIYLIVNAVDGVAPGHYFYNRQTNSLEQLDLTNEVTSRSDSGYLCLGQPLFSDASAVLFMMTDLDATMKTLGNRGYRVCQFEAGVVAGKIYLSSYAQRLGASGSTFYDDAVIESFSPHAKNMVAMIAMGVGVPAYTANPGNVIPARLTRIQLLSEN